MRVATLIVVLMPRISFRIHQGAYFTGLVKISLSPFFSHDFFETTLFLFLTDFYWSYISIIVLFGLKLLDFI